MSGIKVPIRKLPHAANLPLPGYATRKSAGVDLLAAVDETVTLDPGARTVVPSGIAIALPAGFEAQVRPRSGLVAEHGVTVANSPGTIDADYRGEIGVILVNIGGDAVGIARGMRIAQMVVAPVEEVDWQEVDTLPRSARDDRGFGSTGTASG